MILMTSVRSSSQKGRTNGTFERSSGDKKEVARALSAANANGAAYGAVAYKQGVYDGVELVSEINRAGRVGSIANKQDFDSEKIM